MKLQKHLIKQFPPFKLNQQANQREFILLLHPLLMNERRHLDT